MMRRRFRSATTALLASAAAPLLLWPPSAVLVSAGDFGVLVHYEPTTVVTAWAILDRDQQSLEAQLKIGTEESFKRADSIYSLGGHSGSYAVIDLDKPLATEIEAGRAVHGLKTSDGKAAKGVVVGDYWGHETSVNILYHVPRDFAHLKLPNMCMVGGLKDSGEDMRKGCYNATGTVQIANRSYKYTYDVSKDTYGHITLSSLSTMAMREMYRIQGSDCFGCPYKEFVQYHEYYQDMAYGTHWIKAALEGREVKYLGRGDADFTGMSLKARAEAVKKGSVFLNVYMYVLRNMRLAVAECRRPCQDACDRRDEECLVCDTTTGSPALAAWDQAVALYVGSLEGPAVAAAGGGGVETGGVHGQFLYNLAEDRCRDFRTCGSDGTFVKGMSNVNMQILAEFAEGQKRLIKRSCQQAENHLDRIWTLMAVPLIQGVLRYAHKIDEKTAVDVDRSDEIKEKRNAEGATFAAAILPKIHQCNPDDAEVLYGNMRIGAQYTDFKVVKDIFEANYDCLGITCEDVGGVYDHDKGYFYDGAAPCTAASKKASGSAAGHRTRTKPNNEGDEKKAAGAIAGAVIGSLLALVCIGCMLRITWCRSDGKETTTAETEIDTPGEEFSTEGKGTPYMI